MSVPDATVSDNGSMNSAVQTDRQLLTKQQLAERLQCSVRTVERRAAAGELPRPLKVGRLVRWTTEQLDQWQEQHQCK